jgi:7-cyano-7-deazaguanine synthase
MPMPSSPQIPETRLADSPPLDSKVAVLYSGGLDSSILLAHLLAGGQRVWPLFIDCDLYWQPEELRWARSFLQAMETPRLEELVVLRMPLVDVYDGHWSITGHGTPDAREPDEHVYLPGRNPLLMIKAYVWCSLHGISQLALGSLKSNPFADAQDDFFLQFEAAMNRAISGPVRLVRPLATLHKPEVMRLGGGIPLELTFSCLTPVDGLHCGQCNKCAERQQAFHLSGMPDRTRYAADERNPIAI